MRTIANSPFSLLESLRRDMNRALGSGWDTGNVSDDAHWVPAVDVSENDSAWFVAVDLPGVRNEDIEITTHEGVLTISGKRDWDNADRREASCERWRGKFLRRFVVPESADVERIEAKYDNGVLAVHLPKLKSAEPRRIAIQ